MKMKSPAQIADTMLKAGKIKANLSRKKMCILSIFAGVFIGFGAVLATIVTHDLSSKIGVGFTKFIGGAVFSVGLMLVVVCGAELFTGNNLVIIAYMEKDITLEKLQSSWLIVYLFNIIGSFLLVIVIYYSGLMSGGIAGKAINIAVAKTNLSFTEAFCRGILCNILVCLAVWMSLSAENTIGKIFACFFPIMAFVACGFEHSVANMYFIPIGILLSGNSEALVAAGSPDISNLNWNTFIGTNLIPVTLGNLVGGAIIVGIFYWLVYIRKVSDKKEQEKSEKIET